jgi:hypothetical protein
LGKTTGFIQSTLGSGQFGCTIRTSVRYLGVGSL